MLRGKKLITVLASASAVLLEQYQPHSTTSMSILSATSIILHLIFFSYSARLHVRGLNLSMERLAQYNFLMSDTANN